MLWKKINQGYEFISVKYFGWKGEEAMLSMTIMNK